MQKDTIIDESRLVTGQVMRNVPPLAATDSLGKAARAFRKEGLPFLPVTDQGQFLGIITEECVAKLLLDDPESPTTVNDLLEAPPFFLSPFMPFGELTAMFRDTGLPAALVVDPQTGRYLGIVTRADVLAAATGYLTPPLIGGMATPLGVYLTTGAVTGGAGWLGLLLVGAELSLVFRVAQVLLGLGAGALARATGLSLFHDLFYLLIGREIQVNNPYTLLGVVVAGTLLAVLSGLALMRILPRLTGLHAAEHQTVNAIEAGEPLTPEAVGRMSRVHPRCGTNLLGIMMLGYLGMCALSIILFTDFGQQHLDLLVSGTLLFGLFAYLQRRSLGTWVQTRFTTRPATPAEIASGIKAGTELLQHHLANPLPKVSPGRRLWNMGLIQAALGASLMGFLLQLLNKPVDKLWELLVK